MDLGHALGEGLAQGLGDHVGGYSGGGSAAFWRGIAVCAILVALIALLIATSG